MKLACLAFTDRGFRLAQRLALALGGTAERCQGNLTSWTERQFPTSEGLVFVGAVGIAVRAVAPYVRSKTCDPAVVVVDESGRYAIPILSGHLGGGNDLARRISACCGAEAVITTATDLRGVFAVDQWAKRQGLQILEPEHIKTVSSKLLKGETVSVNSDFAITNRIPNGLNYKTESESEIAVSVFRHPAILHLVPKAVVLGIGCRREIKVETLEEAFLAFCQGAGLLAESICGVASIDVKAMEPGLLTFCQNHGWTLFTYSAEELNGVSGVFHGSEFVQRTVGTDCVCERSAVRCAGGHLLIEKQAGGGVTMAAAQKPVTLNWEW